jgi:predicted RNA polymerase sigma factor
MIGPTDVLLRLRLRRVTRGYLVDRACAVLVETVRLVDARVAAGLDALDVLAADARLKGHYRLDAVRAHLLEKAGDREAAVAHYRTAAGRTSSVPERNYLVTRAARLA